MKKYFFIFFIVSGCSSSSSDADKLGDAQLCLDKLRAGATSAQVEVCTSKVEGVTSAGAHNIRCSAGFIREGFADFTRLNSAIGAISGGTGSSQVQSLMGLLSFTSAGVIATDFSRTADTFNACYSSLGKGSTLLASFSYFTMGLMNYFSVKGACAVPPIVSGGYRYYDLGACLTSAAGSLPLAIVELVNSGSSDAAAVEAQNSIGAVLIATYSLSCVGTVAQASLCSLLSNAINSGGGVSNPRGVAVNFFTSAVGL
jgi:hypothetical protein